MARPLRIEYAGALYHVTSRGNEGKDVFTGEKKKVSVTVLRFRHGVLPSLARASDVSASH